jgi:hypothetical protein
MVAVAGRLSTAFAHLHEAGRQDGASRNQLLEPTVQHPADQGGVAGDTHGWAPGLLASRGYTGRGPKNQRCEEKKGGPARPSASTVVLLLTYAAVKVRRIPCFSELGEAGIVRYNPGTYSRSASYDQSAPVSRGGLIGLTRPPGHPLPGRRAGRDRRRAAAVGVGQAHELAVAGDALCIAFNAQGVTIDCGAGRRSVGLRSTRQADRRTIATITGRDGP